MLGRLIYTAAMAITEEREALLNEIYDTEHVPALKAVPGVIEVRRYRRIRPLGRSYLAVYEIEHPDVPTSADWLRARDLGRWPTEVRPWTSGVRNGLYAWRGGFGGDRRDDSAFLHLLTLELEADAADAAQPGTAPADAHPDLVAQADYVDLRTGAHLLVAGLRNVPHGPSSQPIGWPGSDADAEVEAYEPLARGAAG